MCSLLLLSERESSLRRPAPDAVPRRSDLREWIARKRIAVGQTPRALTCWNLHLSNAYLTNGQVHDNHRGTAHRGGPTSLFGSPEAGFGLFCFSWVVRQTR